MNLKILTWNVNGLNEKTKRNKIANVLKKKKLDVICIQETHVVKKHKHVLVNKNLGIEFINSGKEKKRGVVTYVDGKWEPKLIYKDEEGRILGVQISFKGEKINVVNIYAPNTNRLEFYKKLEQVLLELGDNKMILLGDFNAVPTLEMDRQTDKRKRKQGKLPESFHNLEENMDLTDVWRHKHPTEKQFTFFSEVHKSWGRIDQIWASRAITLRVTKCEIQPRTLSDHNSITLEIKGESQGGFRWRLNDYLLDNDEVIEKARATLKEYLVLNLNTGTNIEIVWDASKAVLRGFFIQQNNYRKKIKQQKIEEILGQLREHEKKLTKNPKDEQSLQSIKILQRQYSILTNQEIEWKIKTMRQRYFESANKTGKFLAWQLRKRQKQNVINKIMVGEELITDPKRIQQNFLQFYEELYKKGEEDLTQIEKYLERSTGKTVTEEERTQLNRPISLEETERAIKKMKLGKAPGPDGLSAKYYKVLGDQLVQTLCDTMNNILRGGKVPESWKEAFITLIHKPDTDKLNMKNYRPISLLNNDYKIYTDIMANRLKKCLINLIHKDQVGFLPNRFLKDNVRHVVNIIEHLEVNNNIPASLIFIDAEKAFDNVSWRFLVKSIEKAGIEGEFLKGIQAIYLDQYAKLVINNNITNRFKIEKGTRQGCPLSPLLFILVLEILANKIRSKPEIKGIKIGSKEYKLKAYADDLMLSLEEPQESLGKALEILEEYGKVSGFKLNKTKTKMLTKNIGNDGKEGLESQYGIKVAKKIKYLGIWLTPKNINLIEDNYTSTWNKVKKDLDVWNRVNLSWLGRMEAIKMNILPRMLFLFQNIPVIRGTKIFKDWRKTLSRFIWQGRRPRIRFKLLTDCKERGGLAVPDLKLYYEAACLCWVKDWITLDNTDLLDLEGAGNRHGWHAYLWSNKETTHKGFSNHIIRGPLYEVWVRNKKLLEWKTPWWLSPTNVLSIKKINMEEPKLTYEDLLVKSQDSWRLRPYEEIKGCLTGWLQYHQINAKWTEDKKIGMNEKKSKFQIEIIESKSKILSKMYKILLEWETKDEEIKEVMVKWAMDLGHNIEYKKWSKLWNEGLKFTASAAIRENLVKMVYRWYLTPEKLSRMYKTADKICWRCKIKEGSFMHMWWTCEEIKKFWDQVYNELKKILRYTFPKDPEAFLLGMVGKEIQEKDKILFQYSTAAARILIAQNWKSTNPPSVKDWQLKLFDFIELARMTQRIRDKKNTKLKKDWDKFMIYFEDNFRNLPTIAGVL
uniref:Reverse transcriptase domain-containing protein n=1 Tax=Podarcis muralis TaxID=64176 RepID=A0A670ITK0_PODMU